MPGSVYTSRGCGTTTDTPLTVSMATDILYTSPISGYQDGKHGKIGNESYLPETGYTLKAGIVGDRAGRAGNYIVKSAVSWRLPL
jgi:hypothetical protein